MYKENNIFYLGKNKGRLRKTYLFNICLIIYYITFAQRR